MMGAAEAVYTALRQLSVALRARRGNAAHTPPNRLLMHRRHGGVLMMLFSQCIALTAHRSPAGPIKDRTMRRAGLLAALVLALALAARGAAAARTLAAAQQRVPLYGNWCGPGQSHGKPIDAADACCMVRRRARRGAGGGRTGLWEDGGFRRRARARALRARPRV